MPFIKCTLKTVRAKISNLPKFAKTSWSKLRGRSLLAPQGHDLNSVVSRSVAIATAPASVAGDGGQVAELRPTTATGSSTVLPASIPVPTAPPASAFVPSHLPQFNQAAINAFLPYQNSPGSPECAFPEIGRQVAGNPASLLGSSESEASHGSNRSGRSDGSAKSPCDTLYQTSIEPSSCPSFAGTNALESIFREEVITTPPLRHSPLQGLPIHGYTIRPGSESTNSEALIATNHNVEELQGTNGSTDAPTSVLDLDDPPVVRTVRLNTHPWYKKVRGRVQMPQDSIPVKFTDTKRPMEAIIPARAASILPLEYIALPKGSEVPWKKVRELGKGTFGSVVLQRHRVECSNDTWHDQYTAAKHIRWTEGKTPEDRALLRLMPRMEYALLKKLGKASHVVHAQEMYEDPIQGTCSILMEYIQGVSLGDWVCWNLESVWPASTCVALGFQLFAGIVQIQTHGIIHADIKPDNIMVKQNGHLIICDFGLAYIGDATLLFGGTRQYTPPEVEQGVHSARDVYAAGTTLAEVMEYMCRSLAKPSWEIRLRQKIDSCRIAKDWEARPSALCMQSFMRCLQMTEYKLPPMDEHESRRLIEQQLKDDPPRKPSRAQIIRWTVEHGVRAIAAKAMDYCRLP
ncbi:hypothetical protein FRB93_005591 [Tulasnella sp. JGI-2019a]|nr:hypothetical protein FRB93_005591 [Tulasnella sp. JGI-2019a]